MEYLNDEQALEIIERYLKNDIADYAIMIDGPWGCGKTSFVNRKVKYKINPIGKTMINISLYGKTSLKEIEDEIYKEIIFKKMPENKYFNIIKSGGKLLLKAVNETVNVSFKNIEVDINTKSCLNLVKEFTDLDKYVLVFDDVERADIPITQFLGFVNSYVEKRACKCILIANQNEIGKLRLCKNVESKMLVAASNNIIENEEQQTELEKNGKFTVDELLNRADQIFNCQNEYKIIFEKTIGYTIYYRADFDTLFKNICNNKILDSVAVSLLKEKREYIKSEMNSNNIFNFRILKYICFNFNEIVKIIKDEYKDIDISKDNYFKKTILGEILCCFTDASIQYKSGKEISVHSMRSDYETEKNDFNIVNYTFIKDIIEKSVFDRKCIIYCFDKACENAEYVNDNKDDPLNILDRQSYDLDDEDTLKNYMLLLENIRQDKYKPNLYEKIVRVFLRYNKFGFDEIDEKKLVEIMKKNVIDKEYEVKLNPNYEFFVGKDTSRAYKKIMDELVGEKKNELKLAIDKSFESDEWGIQLDNNCFELMKNKAIQKEKSISYIDMDKLLNKLLNSKCKNLHYFYAFIVQFLEKVGNINYCEDDVRWINNLRGVLQMKLNKDEFEGVMRKYWINCIMKILEEKFDDKLA